MDQQPFGEERPMQSTFGTNNFAENPEPRVPCVLILDVSSSMSGEPIRQLNDGLTAYKDELSADSLASRRVEVSVITFGSEVHTPVSWATSEGFFPPVLEANGLTYMGQAVDLAIDSIERRKQEYKEAGISYYRPWLFLVSDGAPNDENWEMAAARSKQGDQDKSFAMFCVGVQGADMETLSQFSAREPLKLDGLRFRDMFLWLSSSQKAVSRSTPGDEVALDNPTAPGGWGSIS